MNERALIAICMLFTLAIACTLVAILAPQSRIRKQRANATLEPHTLGRSAATRLTLIGIASTLRAWLRFHRQFATSPTTRNAI